MEQNHRNCGDASQAIKRLITSRHLLAALLMSSFLKLGSIYHAMYGWAHARGQRKACPARLDLFFGDAGEWPGRAGPRQRNILWIISLFIAASRRATSTDKRVVKIDHLSSLHCSFFWGLGGVGGNVAFQQRRLRRRAPGRRASRTSSVPVTTRIAGAGPGSPFGPAAVGTKQRLDLLWGIGGRGECTTAASRSQHGRRKAMISEPT